MKRTIKPFLTVFIVPAVAFIANIYAQANNLGILAAISGFIMVAYLICASLFHGGSALITGTKTRRMSVMFKDLEYMGYVKGSIQSLSTALGMYIAEKPVRDKPVKRWVALLTYRLKFSAKPELLKYGTGRSPNGRFNLFDSAYVENCLIFEVYDAIRLEQKLHRDIEKNPAAVYPLASYIFADLDYRDDPKPLDVERIKYFYQHGFSLTLFYALKQESMASIEALDDLPESWVAKVFSVELPEDTVGA